VVKACTPEGGGGFRLLVEDRVAALGLVGIASAGVDLLGLVVALFPPVLVSSVVEVVLLLLEKGSLDSGVVVVAVGAEVVIGDVTGVDVVGALDEFVFAEAVIGDVTGVGIAVAVEAGVFVVRAMVVVAGVIEFEEFCQTLLALS